ncbi:MAG: FG-GAP-like repeat-containing protein [Candidatus Dormibacter sp.]
MLSTSTSARGWLRALALGAALAAVVGVVAPLPGSAASPPASAASAAAGTRDFRTASVPADVSAGQGSGAGFCGSVSGLVGSTTVRGYNLGPSFDNVYACGPTENMGWSNDPFESDFQCVELSTRFMWEVYGLRAAPGNGGVFVANNHARFPSIGVGTPSVGNIPLPGDVVSLSGGAANPNADPPGHTAVVTDVSHVNMATGNGYITVMEENDGGPGTGRINVTNWSEAMGNPQYANGFYWYPTVSWLQLVGSFAPGAGGETRVCATCAPPLLNHRGPVMGTAEGDNTVTSLYWSGGDTFSPGYQNIIDGYLSNVSQNSPATNVYGSNSQYQYVAGPPTTVPGPFKFAGRLTDTSALPIAGCFPDPQYSTCLSYLQVQNEVDYLIHTQVSSPALDLGHLYVLFLPPGVEACTSPASCSVSSLCGYHSSYTQPGATVLYAVVPYPTTQACTTGQSPNGDPFADGAIDTLSHQLNEALIDPLANAWTDAAGNEIGDLCANLYGAPLGNIDATKPLTTQYNQLIGSGRYYTQEEFSNANWVATGHGCVQRVPQVSTPPANTVAVAASLTRIGNDGSSSSTITASARSPQQSAVAGDRFHFASFSSSGTCGTLSPTDVTADASGQASVTYAASTANVNCTVIAVEAAGGQNGSLYLHPFDGCNGTPLAGDFTGDGKVDVAAVGLTGICVLPSNGTSFPVLTPWSSVPFYGQRSTLSADVNGDGKADLVAVNSDGTWVLPSNGAAFASPQHWSSTAFYGQRATFAADLNGDGKADLVAVNDSGTWVMLSTGTGYSAPQPWSAAAFYGSRTTFAVDLTGNGRSDLVAVDGASTWVMLNTGNGFAAPQQWSKLPFYGSRVTLAGDVNGDKRADLVAVSDASVWVMSSSGAGFSAPQPWRSGAFYGGVATLGADVTGNGKMDLIAVNPVGTWVSLATGSAYTAVAQWWTQSP